MSNADPAADGDADADIEEDEGDQRPSDRHVERSFTCVLCGFAMVHEVRPLRTEVRSVCHNCGDWTTQRADFEELVETARELADDLAGETLTDRQALAYLLREELGIEREAAAEAMDSTPSNVDNLQRRAVEKVEDADRVVGSLECLRPEDGDAAGESDADDEPDEPGTGPRPV